MFGYMCQSNTSLVVIVFFFSLLIKLNVNVDNVVVIKKSPKPIRYIQVADKVVGQHRCINHYTPPNIPDR